MFQYPYGDTQQLNLDWLMEQWQETKASIDGSLQGEIDRVEAAITDLLTARDQAVAAKTAAETAATSASGYAGTASTAASTATAQATAAAGSAALAGTHASNAQTSETNAGLQATAAGNSAAAAAVSAGNASNSEGAAAASSSAAAGNALYAEGMAKGTQNGTPVTSGSPYYEDNAAYWAGEAQSHASNAIAASYYSEAMAKGTVNGTPVASGDPGYEDNAEYYKDQAAAQAAAASAASADGTNAQKMIAAPEEATSTAAAAHAAGTYFRYNSKLYKATQDIPLGGTITPNTNCVEDTVCAELTAQSEQIGELKTALGVEEDFNNKLYTIVEGKYNPNRKWEYGVFETNGYTNSSNTNYCRSEKMPAGNYIITAASGYYFEVYYYNSDSSGTSARGMSGTTLELTATGAFVVSSRKNPTATITTANLENYNDYIKIEKIVSNNSLAQDVERLSYETISSSGDITNDVRLIEDYYLNGTGGLSFTANSGTTDFIKVEYGEIYEVIMKTTSGTQWLAWGLYSDANSGFIKRSTLSTPTTTDGTTKIFKAFVAVPPDNSVKSIRFSFGASYDSYSIRKIRLVDRERLAIKSVNHRGFQTVAPENTIPAFKLSKLYGFNWIETDVRLTQDSVPVILHDATINRTARNADGTEISSTINIADITYEDALDYDFGIWKGSAYAGTKIPTFAECMAFCKKIGLSVRIELKTEAITTSDIQALVDIIRKNGMERNVEFASYDLELIAYIDEHFPSFDLAPIKTTINNDFITLATTLKTNTNHKTTCCVGSNTEANLKLLAETEVDIDFFTISAATDVFSYTLFADSYTTNEWDCGAVLFLDSIA